MIHQVALLVSFLLFQTSDAVHQHQKRLMPMQPCISPYPHNYLNASAVYDSTTEFCCNGKVQPKTRTEKCCGEGVYKPSRQLCCSGVVYELKVGYQCCGNETYETEKQMCCETRVIHLDDPTNPHLKCCRNQLYDTTKQKCCQITYDTSAVLETPSPNNMSCCGNKLYDPETQSCCSNLWEEQSIVHNKSGVGMTSHQCCGTQLWDTSTESCCGNVTYNLTEQACCYVTDKMMVVDVSKSGGMCCGISGKTYDYTTQLCCSDQIYNKTTPNLECCGNETINTDEEICCWTIDGSRSIRKETPEHNACCEDQSYNMFKQICCPKDEKGILHPTEDESERYKYGCCGTERYDYTKQMCCGDKVVKQPENSSVGCCGNDTYNTKKQTCCWSFDPTTGTSSATLINDVKPSAICCAGELYTTSSNKGCCNDKVFDTANEVCCGSKIISKNGKESREACCYDYMNSGYEYDYQKYAGVDQYQRHPG